MGILKNQGMSPSEQNYVLIRSIKERTCQQQNCKTKLSNK